MCTILTCLASLLTFAAPDNSIWQIGQFDNDTAELALGPRDYRRYSADAIFLVGQSDPRTDWPYVHPGPVDEWAKGRAHDFTVLFGLADVSADAAFALTLDFVDTQAVKPPKLTLLANGKAAGTWQAPRGATDASIEGDPPKG